MNNEIIRFNKGNLELDVTVTPDKDTVWLTVDQLCTLFGSLTLAHSQNSQMSFMYGFFFVKFLFFTVVCVVIVI